MESPSCATADRSDSVVAERLPVDEIRFLVDDTPYPPFLKWRRKPQNIMLMCTMCDDKNKKWLPQTIVSPIEAHHTDGLIEHPGVVKKYPTFRVSFAHLLVNEFTNPNHRLRWIDMSAGWGDRLLAALSNSRLGYYHAFEPNVELAAGHQTIIAKYGGDNADRVRIQYVPFETADLGSTTYNVALISPPLYDSERHADVNRWRDTLLLSLTKIWGVLDPGGIMLVDIDDVSGNRICERMIDHMHKQPEMDYRGVMSLFDESGRRPIWIFMKRMTRDDICAPDREW